MVEMCIPWKRKIWTKASKRGETEPILLNYSLKWWVKEYAKAYELYPKSVGSQFSVISRVGDDHIYYLKRSIKEQSGNWTGGRRTSSLRTEIENMCWRRRKYVSGGAFVLLLPFQFFDGDCSFMILYIFLYFDIVFF